MSEYGTIDFKRIMIYCNIARQSSILYFRGQQKIEQVFINKKIQMYHLISFLQIHPYRFITDISCIGQGIKQYHGIEDAGMEYRKINALLCIVIIAWIKMCP